jgi:hypothetical protein
MESNCLRALKSVPGGPVVAFSQSEATKDSLEELVFGAIPIGLDKRQVHQWQGVRREGWQQ